MSGLATLRHHGRAVLKQAAGRAVAAALPQCDFSRALFLFGHMRCGSTALANVLCAHPAISGYGEAHVAYDGPEALGRLVVNQRRRGAWKPGARHLFDKVLHGRYDASPHPALFRSHAVFLVREPEPTIRSIRTLFAALGSTEYATDRAAADYYEDRLEQLASLWPHFAPDRRMALTHAALVADPETALARITTMLALDPPLVNRYAAGPQGRGSGDPLASHRFTGIVPGATAPDRTTRPLDLTPARRARLDAAFEATCVLLGCGADRGGGG